MPSSSAPRTTARTASTPARCPALRSSPRRSAQRPLPSMMMATCFGSRWLRRSDMASDLEDLRLLAADRFVDLGHVGVGEVLDLLLHLLAALLGERRDRDADQLAVVLRGEAEVRGTDRLLDVADRTLVVGRDHDQTRVRRAEVRELLERRGRAVVLHLQSVQKRRVRAPGPHLLEVDPQALERLLHLVSGLVQDDLGVLVG